jgi:hypothetical protein
MRALLARQLSSQAVPAHYPLHAKAIARPSAVRLASAVIGGTNRGLSVLGFGPTVTKSELKGADFAPACFPCRGAGALAVVVAGPAGVMAEGRVE